MLKLDRICYWLLLATLVTKLPSINFLKFADELISFSTLGIAALDCLVNGHWRRYKLLWLLLGIFGFYAIYSFAIASNTTRAILSDFVIQFKPFLPFVVFFAVKPTFTEAEKRLAKWVCLANVLIVCVIYIISPNGAFMTIISHPMEIGITAFVGVCVWVLFSAKPDGTIERRDLAVIALMLALGLISTRSKYYGQAVIAMFFIWLYKPGMTRHIKPGYIITVIAVLLLVVAVSWQKFSYYFISGVTSDLTDIDASTAQSFARPVLYATMGLILVDHFPFGSGLASFATYASVDDYSGTYYEYGINNVWGLSPEYPNFICDTFYPELAQFGIVGVVLFVVLFCWIYKHLRRLLRADTVRNKWAFVAGALIVTFLLIESVANTTLVKMPGMICMMLLGAICGQGSLARTTPAGNEPVVAAERNNS